MNVKNNKTNETVINMKHSVKNKKVSWFWGSIVAFFIVVIAIIVFFVFFNNSIVGSWSKSGNDISYFLTFKDDGTVTITKESMSVDGKYILKDNNTVNFDVSMNSKNFMSGDYKYKIVSNFSDKKLELTDNNGNKEIYNQSKLPEMEKLKDFSAVQQLLGRWKNDDLGIEYEFFDDSIAILKKDNIMFKFNYTADDQKVTLKSKTSAREQESEVKYSINNNVLKIGGIEYIKQ